MFIKGEGTLIAITESVKNIRHAISHISYTIGDYEISPDDLFTFNNSRCLHKTENVYEQTCYLALKFNKSESDVQVTYSIEMGSFSKKYKSSLQINTFSMFLYIGIAASAFILLIAVIFGCYIGVFYALNKQFPEKFSRCIRHHQEQSESGISLKKKVTT